MLGRQWIRFATFIFSFFSCQQQSLWVISSPSRFQSNIVNQKITKLWHFSFKSLLLLLSYRPLHIRYKFFRTTERTMKTLSRNRITKSKCLKLKNCNFMEFDLHEYMANYVGAMYFFRSSVFVCEPNSSAEIFFSFEFVSVCVSTFPNPAVAHSHTHTHTHTVVDWISLRSFWLFFLWILKLFDHIVALLGLNTYRFLYSMHTISEIYFRF